MCCWHQLPSGLSRRAGRSRGRGNPKIRPPPLKFAPTLKFRHFENFWNIQRSFNLTPDMERSSQIMQTKYFHGDDVIDDVTGRPQHRPSIFPYECKINFFRDNWTKNRDIIIILSVYMYHGIVNMLIQIIMDYITDDVIRAPNKSKLWTAIALSIFELKHRPKAQNVTNGHGYLCSIFKCRCHFR